MASEPRSRKDGVSRRSRAVGIFCAFFPVLVVLWVLLVLYPNPLNLAVSVQRLTSPQVDPAAVETLAAGLPADPAAIEEAVIKSVPYSYDWEAYAMPWYFPTVEEVLKNGEGDCKARAIVLASILEAKGIPYRIDSSPMHVWVDYDGKVEDELENSGAGFYEVDPQTGARSLQVPRVSVTKVMSTAWQGFWPPMPLVRKVLFAGGLVALVAIRVIWPRRAGLVKGSLPEAQDEKHPCPPCEKSQPG